MSAVEQELAQTLSSVPFCPACHRLMELSGRSHGVMDWECVNCDRPESRSVFVRRDEHEPKVVLPDEGLDLNRFVGSVIRSLIEQALRRTQENKAAAARLLRMNRTALLHRMKAFEMPLNEPYRKKLCET